VPAREPVALERRRPRARRLRRLRRSEALRELFAETSVEPRRLVCPVFARPGAGAPQPVEGMPGVERHAVGTLGRVAGSLASSGLRSMLLFGIARRKSADGREAWADDGVVPTAIRAAKRAAPSLVVVSDVCLCAYTTHGHCGPLDREGLVDNDRAVESLARVSVAHARAGADLVAPSAMMDGQVAGIRRALDAAGFARTGILAYSTKHASALYGPFREAEGSAPSFGDRRSYQMDWRNGREAMRELEADAREGADVLMVKPAITSLDLLARARERFDLPLAAYQVSGEYAMIKDAARRGHLEERAAVEETLGAIRRAGADLIVTYFARDVAGWARGGP
jgi:porphobilinogen synthase